MKQRIKMSVPHPKENMKSSPPQFGAEFPQKAKKKKSELQTSNRRFWGNHSKVSSELSPWVSFPSFHDIRGAAG
jgi:hypothetical protein